MFKFNLRDKVKDQITGMEGAIIARTEWLNGCIRYSVQPLTLKDGSAQESIGFDEQQLDLLEEVTQVLRDKPRTGGDRIDASRAKDPRRV